MKEKYFIPKIEELFVGYETEEIFFGEFSSFFTPASLESLEAYYLSEKTQSTPVIIDNNKLVEIILLNDLPVSKGGKGKRGLLGIYRTLYLTKEQIEKEGFDFKRDYKETFYFEKGDVYKIGGIFLDYNISSKTLKVSINKGSFDNSGTPKSDNCFNGKVKCINEFKNILKYLSINT